MFYYAEINNDYLVTNTYSLEESSTNENYIVITEEQYNSDNLVGKYYNSLVGAFEIIDMMNYMGNSDFVTHYDTQMPLSTKIDNMQAEINSKADINHTHNGYASANDLTLLEDVVDTKANSVHSHTEYALSSHSHDNIYYTETEIDTKLSSKADTSHTHTGVYDINGAAADALTSANAYTNSKIDALIGEGASTTLDTIGEISSAIEDNQDAIDLLNSAIANKANIIDLNSHASDTELHITNTERNNWNAKSNFSGNYNDLTNKPNIPSINGLATETYVDTQISAIDIPNALSDLTTDSTHRVVTDAEKATWNSKSDFSGNYNDLTNKPSIPSISGLATETYVDEAVSTKANATHSHDDIYYTETEINTKLSSKSDTSHTHTGVYDVNGAANSALASAKEYADELIDDEVINRNSAISTAKNSAISTAASDATTKANNALASANSYTDTKVAALVGSAPDTMDTLKELADAIASHEDVTDALDAAIGTKANSSDLTSHTGNKSNPHSVTKSQVGLGNVPNVTTNDQVPTYSDATTFATLVSGEKLSVALSKIKLAITNLINHIANNSNPHGVTKSQVGLGNVDNTSDANKPISTATQTALDGKASSSHTHSAVTTSVAGFMSASDKSKLDGITANADSVSFSRSLTAGTKVGTITINGSSTDLYAPTNTDTHYTSGTVVNNGSSAVVNTTSALTNGNVYLNHIENGSVKNSHKISGSGATAVTSDASGNIIISSTNTTYGVATSSGLGLVKSGADITVDSSGNVSINDDSHNHVISNIDNLQSSLDTKQPTITGGATTIASANLTPSRALVSDSSGKVAVSAVTSTELGYLDGVTSSVQTQLNGKSSTSHTHNYAGSSSSGGAASSANKLNTNAGSATQPVYFTNGVPVATTYSLNKSVPSNAVFTDTTYSDATTTTSGLMSSTDKSKLDSIANNANAYTLPAAGTSLGGVKSGGDVTISSGVITVNDDSHNHIISNVDGLQSALDAKSDSTHTHSVATTSANGFMSSAMVTKLNGIATGANKTTVDSSLSSTSTNPVQNKVVKSALDNKISKDLQFIGDNGGCILSYVKTDNKNILTEIGNLSVGFYTIYSQTGVTGNPKTTEAWRMMVHKTNATIGWVQAYGSNGSVYTNYRDGDNGWRGWKCLWDDDPEPLWSGAMYMSSPNSTPQTVTPSKSLSQCRNGWLLLWSDYDPGSGANDTDFVTTMIPKRNPSGGTWGGKAFYCDIPRYIGSNVEDVDTERRIIKSIYIHDNCIKGSFNNDKDERNDVVLRAVYEW